MQPRMQGVALAPLSAARPLLKAAFPSEGVSILGEMAKRRALLGSSAFT